MTTHQFPYSRALVTGAGGFIGTALCDELVRLGVEVVGTARQPREGLSRRVSWRFGDLTAVDFARHLILTETPDVIFHLSSFVSGDRRREVVLEALHSNLTSTVNLLVAAADSSCRRTVLSGSMEEPPPGDPEPPCSPYAAAKWAAEGYARMFHALYDTSVVTARPSMVYGPAQRDRKKLVPFVIESFLNGRAPELSSGMRRVDWIYVADVVEAYLRLAVADGVEGQTFDVGSGERLSVREVVEEIEALMRPGIAPRWGAVPDRPLERLPVADTESTYRATGWRAQVSLREGLRRTIAWYRDAVPSR